MSEADQDRDHVEVEEKGYRPMADGHRPTSANPEEIPPPPASSGGASPKK